MATAKLTKLYVERYVHPESGQHLVWDTDLPGFGLRVGTRSKAFIAEARLNKKTVRTTVGTYPRMTPEVARRKAREILQGIELGVDPRRTAEGQPTVNDAFAAFMSVRQLAARTKFDYERYFRTYFNAWHTRPLKDISPALVSKRHLEIAEKHGPSQANSAMRFLRSLYNFAREEYAHQALPENPVRTLRAKRQWFREHPRQNIIRSHQLPAWFTAVLALKNDESSQDRETFRDYFLVLLLLGLRRSEAAKLRIENVDLAGRTVTVLETKNKAPKVLPVGPYLHGVLRRRLEKSTSPWLFASALDPRNHIVEPKKALLEVKRNSGIEHTLHDLRRSFATLLDALDVSVYQAKRLMGHTVQNDVLGHHYVVTDVERLRPAITKLETYVLTQAGVPFTGDDD